MLANMSNCSGGREYNDRVVVISEKDGYVELTKLLKK